MFCNVGSTETYDELEIRAVKKLQSEYWRNMYANVKPFHCENTQNTYIKQN